MASDNEACCESDPNFAVICGFLEKFGVTCGLANIDFIDLQYMLENSQEVPQELIDLHVKLLRKARKSVTSERWERAVIKFCHGFCSQDAWEIERFGYKKARLSSKLRILKELLEMQFDYNARFKTEVNKLSAEELRTQPLGKDRLGHVYWYQSDEACQIRVYKEDPDEETWALVVRSRDDLVNLITDLNDGRETVLNEDSNSLESEKPIIDTGQTDSNSDSSKPDRLEKVEESPGESSSESKEMNDHSTKKLVEEDDDEEPKATEVTEAMDLQVKESQQSKNDTAEIEEKANAPTAVVSPPKTGINLRIKPIGELLSTSTAGIKEKYIRSEPSSILSFVHHRKAVDSAGFDVHANYLKRPLSEVEDDEVPAYIKRSRLDRPTLLGNKKKKPYSEEEEDEEEEDADEEEEDEVSDEIEEPLMLVKGEGSGHDNKVGNFHTKLQAKPTVSEEIVEDVIYFHGVGNGVDCETGNDNKDAEPQSNTLKSVDEVQETSEMDSINQDKPSTSAKDSGSLVTSKTEFKLGTIIDVRTNNLSSPLSSPTKRSRWDIGKPCETVSVESPSVVTEPKKLFENSNVDNNVEQPINVFSAFKSYKAEKESVIKLPLVEKEHFIQVEPKRSTFFFGPGSLTVKPPSVNFKFSESGSATSSKKVTEMDCFSKNLEPEEKHDLDTSKAKHCLSQIISISTNEKEIVPLGEESILHNLKDNVDKLPENVEAIEKFEPTTSTKELLEETILKEVPSSERTTEEPSDNETLVRKSVADTDEIAKSSSDVSDKIEDLINTVEDAMKIDEEPDKLLEEPTSMQVCEKTSPTTEESTKTSNTETLMDTEEKSVPDDLLDRPLDVTDKSECTAAANKMFDEMLEKSQDESLEKDTPDAGNNKSCDLSTEKLPHTKTIASDITNELQNDTIIEIVSAPILFDLEKPEQNLTSEDTVSEIKSLKSPKKSFLIDKILDSKIIESSTNIEEVPKEASSHDISIGSSSEDALLEGSDNEVKVNLSESMLLESDEAEPELEKILCDVADKPFQGTKEMDMSNISESEDLLQNDVSEKETTLEVEEKSQNIVTVELTTLDDKSSADVKIEELDLSSTSLSEMPNTPQVLATNEEIVNEVTSSQKDSVSLDEVESVIILNSFDCKDSSGGLADNTETGAIQSNDSKTNNETLFEESEKSTKNVAAFTECKPKIQVESVNEEFNKNETQKTDNLSLISSKYKETVDSSSTKDVLIADQLNFVSSNPENAQASISHQNVETLDKANIDEVDRKIVPVEQSHLENNVELLDTKKLSSISDIQPEIAESGNSSSELKILKETSVCSEELNPTEEQSEKEIVVVPENDSHVSSEELIPKEVEQTEEQMLDVPENDSHVSSEELIPKEDVQTEYQKEIVDVPEKDSHVSSEELKPKEDVQTEEQKEIVDVPKNAAHVSSAELKPLEDAQTEGQKEVVVVPEKDIYASSGEIKPKEDVQTEDQKEIVVVPENDIYASSVEFKPKEDVPPEIEKEMVVSENETHVSSEELIPTEDVQSEDKKEIADVPRNTAPVSSEELKPTDVQTEGQKEIINVPKNDAHVSSEELKPKEDVQSESQKEIVDILKNDIHVSSEELKPEEVQKEIVNLPENDTHVNSAETKPPEEVQFVLERLNSGSAIEVSRKKAEDLQPEVVENINLNSQKEDLSSEKLKPTDVQPEIHKEVPSVSKEKVKVNYEPTEIVPSKAAIVCPTEVDALKEESKADELKSAQNLQSENPEKQVSDLTKKETLRKPERADGDGVGSQAVDLKKENKLKQLKDRHMEKPLGANLQDSSLDVSHVAKSKKRKSSVQLNPKLNVSLQAERKKEAPEENKMLYLEKSLDKKLQDTAKVVLDLHVISPKECKSVDVAVVGTVSVENNQEVLDLTDKSKSEISSSKFMNEPTSSPKKLKRNAPVLSDTVKTANEKSNTGGVEEVEPREKSNKNIDVTAKSSIEKDGVVSEITEEATRSPSPEVQVTRRSSRRTRTSTFDKSTVENKKESTPNKVEENKNVKKAKKSVEKDSPKQSTKVESELSEVCKPETGKPNEISEPLTREFLKRAKKSVEKQSPKVESEPSETSKTESGKSNAITEPPTRELSKRARKSVEKDSSKQPSKVQSESNETNKTETGKSSEISELPTRELSKRAKKSVEKDLSKQPSKVESESSEANKTETGKSSEISELPTRELSKRIRKSVEKDSLKQSVKVESESSEINKTEPGKSNVNSELPTRELSKRTKKSVEKDSSKQSSKVESDSSESSKTETGKPSEISELPTRELSKRIKKSVEKESLKQTSKVESESSETNKTDQPEEISESSTRELKKGKKSIEKDLSKQPATVESVSSEKNKNEASKPNEVIVSPPRELKKGKKSVEKDSSKQPPKVENESSERNKNEPDTLEISEPPPPRELKKAKKSVEKESPKQPSQVESESIETDKPIEISEPPTRELRSRRSFPPTVKKAKAPAKVSNAAKKVPKEEEKSKVEDKNVTRSTRSHSQKGVPNKAVDLPELEKQISKAEVRPTKKFKMSESVENSPEKSESTKPNEESMVEDTPSPPRMRKTSARLRRNVSQGKKEEKAKTVEEPKVVEQGEETKQTEELKAEEPKIVEESKNKVEDGGELIPVVEPPCVEKKVPLLTVIDINTLKDPENVDEPETPKAPNVQVIDSSESDDDHDFGQDDNIEDNDDSDSVIIVPENDPLAVTEPEIESSKPAMTLATFKLDVDDSPTLSPIRVTRKRAAQQSVDALRENQRKSKRPQLESKDDDSKRPKLKPKRSVDLNLRRSIEQQKLKEVSSSEDDNAGSATKSKNSEDASSVSKRRSSTRSSKAAESDSETPKVENPPSVEKKIKKTKRILLGLEISPEMENILKDDTPVRQSRRIAQIKIKEEAERRKLEEVTLNDLKEEQRKRKVKKDVDKDYKLKKRNKASPTEDETTNDAIESDEKKKRKRKRKHWNPHKQFDVFKAWNSSSGSSSSEVEDEEEEIEDDDDHHVVLKSDHEFSPESDLEEGTEVQPLKRARTARKESDAEEEEVDDCACQKCGQKDHPEWILLCDSCDSGWHCSCLRPALLVIPEGDWFCPPCQHITLVKKLESQLSDYDKKMNKREMEMRRKERLAYVGISLDNVLPSKEPDEHQRQKIRHREDVEQKNAGENYTEESGSEDSDSESESSSSTESESDEPVYQLRERRQAHSYRFNDYDELINSAIQDELEAVKGAGNQGRGKDIATIVNATQEETALETVETKVDDPQELNINSEPTNQVEAPVAPVELEQLEPEALPPVVPLDTSIKSPEQDSEEEIIRPVKKKLFGKKKHRKLNSLDVSSGDDDADSDEDFKGNSSSESEEGEEDYSVSESSDESRRGKRRKGSGPIRRSTRARVSRYDKDFINDTDSGEEAPRRKKTRSIWDESESEESDGSWGGKGKRKPKRNVSRKKPSMPSSDKPRKSKKKKKRTGDDSDPEVFKKRPNIKFGGLNDDEEVGRRTRGKKINYLEALGSDSEDEMRRKPPRIEESEEEYIVQEDEEFKRKIENEKDSDESGPDAVLQDLAQMPHAKPKSRGRGKCGLKLPRKPKPASEVSDMFSSVPTPAFHHSSDVFPPVPPDMFQSASFPPGPSDMFPTAPEMYHNAAAVYPMNQQPPPLMEPGIPMQPTGYLMNQPILGNTLVQNQELHDIDDEPNPIEQINKNVEQMNEQEMEKMMEEEDYANKQLQLVALQLEKEKKRKEKEALRLESVMQAEQKIPKKRGRKPKSVSLSGSDLVSPYNDSSCLPMNPMMANNAELSEPPGISLPLFSEIVPALNADGTPRKRRGRGKGKKTLAAEAAALVTGKDGSELEGLDCQSSSNSNTVSPAPDSPMHGSKLGIAAPPQPFSQSQPTPSVITRMLQSQSQPGAFSAKFFTSSAGDPAGPGPYHLGASGPRGLIPPGAYQQPPPGLPHYGVVRGAPPPLGIHSGSGPPPGLPPMYHAHRTLDPSPSGGGPITVSTSSRDRHSPSIASPSSSSPISKGEPTPPPPPYTRPQVGHFPPVSGSNASIPLSGSRHVSMIPPPHLQHRSGSGSLSSPYHPGVPPNYHYGTYPPPSAHPPPSSHPPIGGEENQSPAVYPSAPYSENFIGDNGVPIPPSENSSGKPFEDDMGGEFVGLVSYFSSQREDDLDT